MPRVNRVQSARKSPGVCRNCRVRIEEGEPYLHYKFRHGGKYVHHVNHPPKASQLESSDKMRAIREAQEEAERLADVLSQDPMDADAVENLGSDVAELMASIEEVRDEYEESLENMGSLAESDAGYQIQEKIDALNEWVDRLADVEGEASELSDALAGRADLAAQIDDVRDRLAQELEGLSDFVEQGTDADELQARHAELQDAAVDLAEAVELLNKLAEGLTKREEILEALGETVDF